MSIAIITGSSGLIGSEASRHFAGRGLQVIGIDNDMRQHFFGEEASTKSQQAQLEMELKRLYKHLSIDIRDSLALDRLFRDFGTAISLVVHTAAQPSHDWACRDPQTDFSINAQGTLNLLESTRRYCPDAVFIFTSTNKVYGDTPNRLPLIEMDTRWEIAPEHKYAGGIDESMSIDQTMHSLFGASKTAADLLVQEYGQYFGLRTVCFRGGCLTGPNHRGIQLHGFLSYLVYCSATRTPYTVFGYHGKQVRDNIHSYDLIQAFDHFFKKPRCAEVYNIGGGRFSNCSVLEAIEICQAITGEPLEWSYETSARKGDHKWYISDNSKFRSHYPEWKLSYNLHQICEEIFALNIERWQKVCAA